MVLTKKKVPRVKVPTKRVLKMRDLMRKVLKMMDLMRELLVVLKVLWKPQKDLTMDLTLKRKVVS